jgi:hypothetical protein
MNTPIEIFDMHKEKIKNIISDRFKTRQKDNPDEFPGVTMGTSTTFFKSAIQGTAALHYPSKNITTEKGNKTEKSYSIYSDYEYDTIKDKLMNLTEFRSFP